MSFLSKLFTRNRPKKNIHKGKIKLICFDIDNTLCDYSSAEAETEAYMMSVISKDIKEAHIHSDSGHSHKSRGHDIRDSALVFVMLKAFNNIKNSHLGKDLSPSKFSRKLWFKETFEVLNKDKHVGIDFNYLNSKIDIYDKMYWEHFKKIVKNYPETINTLKTLKSKGFILATISDSDGEVGLKKSRISSLGLDSYFDYIITTDDTGVNKPSSENWRRLVSMSKLKPEQCVMVGDHPEIDLSSAKKLGFKTVWTKQNLSIDLHIKYVDYEIKDIKEIIELVEKIS